jgi:hypothetical protein
MQTRWLKFIAFLLLITTKELAMAENLTVSEETRAEITALVAAEEAAWNKGSAEAFAERALPDIVFTNIFGMFSRQSAICRSTWAHFLDDLQGQHQSSADRARHISQARRCDRRYLDDDDGRAASPVGHPVHRRCVTLAAGAGSGAARGRLVDGVLSQRRRESGLRGRTSAKTVKNDTARSAARLIELSVQCRFLAHRVT